MVNGDTAMKLLGSVTRLALVATLVAVALVLVACGGGEGPNPSDLEGATWMLVTSEGTAADLSIADIHLMFDGGEITGSSGINSLMGKYKAKRDGEISFSDLGGTKMGADAELMAAEQAFIAALGAVDTFTFSEEALVLTGPEGLSMTFYASVPGEITGTSWVVAGISDIEGNLVTPIEGSLLTVEFDDKGSVQGSSGVNTFGGSYTVDGESIEIPELGTTLIAAVDEALNVQEAQMLAALQSARSWAISEDLLELYDANGVLVLMAVQSGD